METAKKLTMLLHHRQKFDNDLRARADEHLATPGLLGIVDRVQRIVEHTSPDHLAEILYGELDRGSVVAASDRY